jgi:hypothetical protein
MQRIAGSVDEYMQFADINLDVDILISAGIKPRQKVAKVAGYR